MNSITKINYYLMENCNWCNTPKEGVQTGICVNCGRFGKPDNNIKRFTKEDVDNFTTSLKDRLCMLHEVCLKHKKEFTVCNIVEASYFTSMSVNSKYAEIFLNNLDHIEKLVKNQPSHILSWTSTMTGDDGIDIDIPNSKTYNCYDMEKVLWQKKLLEEKGYNKNINLTGVKTV